MRKVELLPTRDCEAGYGPVDERGLPGYELITGYILPKALFGNFFPNIKDLFTYLSPINGVEKTKQNKNKKQKKSTVFAVFLRIFPQKSIFERPHVTGSITLT